MRVSRTVCVGITAVLTGVVLFGGTRYWIATRTLSPVYMPVSLSRGHLKTGDFKINIRAFYSILVVFPGGSEPNCSEYSLLRTRRLPSIGGRTVNHLEGDVDVHDSTTTVGPFLGGYLVGLNWRLVFLVNLPVGIASFVPTATPRMALTTGLEQLIRL